MLYWDQMNAYFDNGTTTPVAKEVLDAMLPYFRENFGHPIFIYSLGQEAAEAIERSQKIISRTINAKPEEITFTSNGTESIDLAIRGAAYANRRKGNHIITTNVENPSVLRVCDKLESDGFKVDYIAVDKQGLVDLDQLKKTINDKTILVSVANVNDEIGTVQPVDEVARIVREQGRKIFFHVNAIAGYMRVPVDVERLGVDMLSLSAHKIHGPKGVGALYLRKGTRIEPLNYGYVSMSGLKPGTENVAGIVGFAKAAELASDRFDRNVKKMLELRERLMKGIEERMSYYLLHGPRGEKRSPANVNYSFKGVEGEAILLRLDLEGVSVATGSACSTRKLEPSHVLTAIGIKPEVAHSATRFTISWQNTPEEVDYALDVLPGVIENLRKISPIKAEDM